MEIIETWVKYGKIIHKHKFIRIYLSAYLTKSK